MLNKMSSWEWASLGVAAASLLLVLLNAALTLSDQALQSRVAERQAVISEEAQLSRVRQAIVQALINNAVAKNDYDLREVLEHHGISLTTVPAAKGAAP
jgi:hypothetical protein